MMNRMFGGITSVASMSAYDMESVFFFFKRDFHHVRLSRVLQWNRGGGL